MIARAVLLLLLPALLAACDETRFEVDPLGEPRACEPGLEGTWRIVEDVDGAPEYVHLRGNCDLTLLRPPRPGEGGIDLDLTRNQSIELSPAIGRIDGTLFITLTDDDFHRAADEEAADDGHADTPGGFHVYRIELRGDAARLRAVDHRAVAKALIDGSLRGTVGKDDQGLKNRLALDLDAARALLRERWLFRRDDLLRLERVAPQDLPPAVRRQVEENP